MTIPASQLVDITPRVIGGGLSGLAFVGTLLSKSDKLPTNTAVPFYSASEVGKYFGTESDEYKLATVYFGGYVNARKTVDVLWFARKVDSNVPAFVRGLSNVDKLEELKKATDGSLKITVDGAVKTVTALNLSSQTSLSGVATALNAKLTGATCEWDSDFNAFVIKSASSGANSKITFAEYGGTGTDLSVLMGLDSGTLSQGSASKSLTDTMGAIVSSNSNFFSFMPVWKETEQEALELANWCNSQGVRFMYVMVDTSNAGLQPNNPECLGQKVADMYGVLPDYNSKESGAFSMSIAAAVNPQLQNGRASWAYRQSPNLAYTVSELSDALALISNGYNFYGDYANASNRFKLYQEGRISGVAKFADTYYGQVFIKDGLQNAWINALMLNGTIPYNEAGYGILRASAMDVINTAKQAGFIREGVSLSESQKATVNSEAGLDISGALETQGYYLQILDPTVQVRSERGTPIVNFWYMDGGSIQKIQGTSTVLL